MFIAIDSGNVDEVMRLLDADPTLLEEMDMVSGTLGDRLTPLMYAAYVGQLGMVKLLIGRGASIHATSAVLGGAALHYAAAQGHEDVVTYLIHNGALLGAQDTYGNTPLMEASMNGHARVVVLLLERMGGQGLETQNHYGSTALHKAAYGAHEDVVAHLLRNGARVDTNDEDGTSALRDAVRRGHLGVATLLLDHLGPQALQEEDDEGASLLHVAIDGRHEDMVAFLMGKGLTPDIGDNEGMTPLMYSATDDSVRMLQRLLDHTGGPRLDQRDDTGWTALHWAAEHDKPANVRALLWAGADPTIVDNEGRTPRLVAEANGHHESVSIFEWWDGELESGFLLYRARALHDAYTTHQEAPTHAVPGYLKARVGAGLVLPRVEVVVGQAKGGSGEGKRKTAKKPQARHAMVEWVGRELNGHLFTELMQGFHAPRN